MREPMHTAQVACSVRECMRSWWCTAPSADEAARVAVELASGAGAVRVPIGRDAEGEPVHATLCADCSAAIAGAAQRVA